MNEALTQRPFPQAVSPANCPVENWIAFLGHRWNALILWHLVPGAKRHGELAALLPNVSPKVLAERLQGLERRGLIARRRRATYPRQVDYRLTALGEKIVLILDRFEDLPAINPSS